MGKIITVLMTIVLSPLWIPITIVAIAASLGIAFSEEILERLGNSLD